MNFAKLQPLSNLLPDKLYLQLRFRHHFDRWINWKNPQTFNEKLQWLKIYNRNPLYTTLVDKYAVKKWVADKIGEQYVIPTLGVWNSFDEIDFDKLPNQFVLKTTHDSGGVVICQDKKTFNKEAAREKLTKSLKRNFYYQGREWPYKNVPPRIIAEPYLEDTQTKELRDYKFFCFDGAVKLLYVASDRQNKQEETKFDFFDINFNRLPFVNAHPNSQKAIERPRTFEKMKFLAAKLSETFSHIRVDFYEINGQIYFGELTFFHMSGFVPFDPPEWDKKIGDWLVLPRKNIYAN